MSVGIQIRSKGAVAAINAIAQDLPKALITGLLKATYHVENKVKSEVYEKFPDGRTGALARSFKPVFLGRDGNVISAAVQSDLVYARIQEEGGTITAKGKYLAVPISDRIPVGKWPRHFGAGELVRIQKRGGNPILAKITGKKITPMFVLKSSVHLRGRKYLESAEKRAVPGVEEIIGGSVERVVDKANGGGG